MADQNSHANDPASPPAGVTRQGTSEDNPPGRTSRRKLIATGVVSLAAGAAAGRFTAPVTRPPDAHMGGSRFTNQVVMITGATSGIGKAAVERFAAEGADVWFCGRRADRGDAVQEAVRANGGKATYIRADVRVEADIETFAKKILEARGRIDIGFNNAGIGLAAGLLDTKTDQWDDVHHTNLRGVYFAMKHQLPAMLQQRNGSIVVTSSAQARASRANAAAYSSSKYALLGLVQAAALEFGSRGVRVNAVLPGTVDTEFSRGQAGFSQAPDSVWQEAATAWGKDHVPGLRRMATPGEIVSVVLDVASQEASFLTGASITVDGGQSVALP